MARRVPDTVDAARQPRAQARALPAEAMPVLDHLLLRIRAHRAQRLLPDDTDQLLSDLEGLLTGADLLAVRSAPPLAGAGAPADLGRAALLEAATTYLESTGRLSAVLPIPARQRTLVVAVGEPDVLYRMLVARSHLTDH